MLQGRVKLRSLCVSKYPAASSHLTALQRRRASGGLLLTALSLLCSCFAHAQTPVLTQHNDIGRTGQNLTETTLTPANVNTTAFGKLFSYPVDGRIYAQPLYMANVTMGAGTKQAGTKHNVIFVATEHDSVYAFDADLNGGSNAAPLWQVTMLDTAHGAASGATSIPNGDLSTGDIQPEVGITGTPVIDPSTNTLYVVSASKENLNYFQRLHALDITTGLEKFGGPVAISAQVSGTGNGSSGGVLSFDTKWENNRAGLLLLNGIVYLGFASHGDNGSWHGWILAYNASTLAQTGVYCSTSSGAGSGIWMAGSGLAADTVSNATGNPSPGGRLFVATGNGSFSATTAPYTNSMSYGDDLVRLDLNQGTLKVGDHFTPLNQANLNNADEDVASGGILLLPDQTTGGHTHLMLQAGKEGRIYLVDRDSLGGYSATADNIVQEVPVNNAAQSNQTYKIKGLWSMPAYWNGNLYFWGNGDTLKAFSFSGGKLSNLDANNSPNPTSTATPPSGFPGATPSISANGASNGIVWAVQTDNYASAGSPQATLWAFDATNVTTPLYSSAQNATRDNPGISTKFVTPTITNGKVYVGTANFLSVYGELNGQQQASAPALSPGQESFVGTIQVAMSSTTAGASIFYTTDGSVPTTLSTLYTAPISVSSTETISAIASTNGFLQSPITTEIYTLQTQTPAPTFNPPAGSYNIAQSIAISDSLSGAKIYYTTDGSMPVPGQGTTQLYSQPVTLSVTTTLNAIATSSSLTSSPVSSSTYTIVLGATGINFTNGFSASQSTMTFNGSTGLDDTRLQLTSGVANQAGSAWFDTPVNISSFTNDFTFQLSAPSADGMTFAIQNQGLTALGPSGGGLGYGPDAIGGTSGIPNSVAIKFDLYNNNGEGVDSTGLYLNGVSPTTPFTDLTGSGIDLHSGDTFSVHMVYNDTTLTMTITDGVTAAHFTTSWTVNIPSVIGSSTAYVGFTGGTGGQTASQKVETWTFLSTGGTQQTVATPTFSLAGGTYLGTQTVSLSDTTAGSTIFYTLDGTTPATSVGGSTLQYSSALTVTATETIKALATASGFAASPVASATYTIEQQATAPIFSPAPGAYLATQSVTITTPTPGATIFYTLDGTTPGTAVSGSTLQYSSAIAVNASETIKAIAIVSGFFNSNVSTGAYSINSSGVSSVNLGTGFTTGAMILNGSSALNGARLRLTDNGGSEAGSAWFPSPVNIAAFTTNFSFQITPGTNPLADGMTFTIQGNNTAALGPAGGGLGYGPDTVGGAAGIGKSVTVKFDLYSNAGEGTDSTGIYTNGVSPTTPFNDMTSSTVLLNSGHIMNVQMKYDGTNLVMTITDATTAAVFTQSWPINIPSTVGGNTAYVGFTGGTGGDTAIQEIIGWTLTSNLGAAATPTFSLSAGTYLGTQSVSLSDTTPGAVIYYTTNGSQPTNASTQYPGAAISVTASETINAIAYATNFAASPVASAAYVIETQVATPTFSPAPGTYTSAQSVTISSATSGATIYYTTNNTAPTTSSAQYTGTAISVGTTETLQAIAVKSGFFNSNVATGAYTINIPLSPAATPVITPATGAYSTVQTVTITDTTPSSTIYYTLDNSTPTTSSTKYTSGFSVGSTTTVKAIAVATGFTNSATASSVITVNLAPAATPVITPATGAYTSAQNVTITDSTSSSMIYYTLDGSTPTASSTKYTAGFVVSSATTVKAIAVATGFSNSATAASVITINLPAAAAPSFSPAAGNYTTATSVTLSDTTPSATIYYTLDGSTPGITSTKYTGAFVVGSTTTVKAVASASGFTLSPVSTAVYTITPPAATPTFSLATGTYSGTQSVTLSDTTAGATIYYTTDNSTPTPSSTKYTAAISVTSTETIKAIAVATGFSNSAVASATYTIQAATILLGNNAISPVADSNSAGSAEAFPFTATASGTLGTLTVYVGAGNASSQLIVGIYADASNKPGTLLAQGSIASPKSSTWTTVTVPSVSIASGVRYWIAILGTGGTLTFRDNTQSCSSYTSSSSSLTVLPGTWSTGATWSPSCPLSAYGTSH
jgi:hypothetical protein